MRVWRFSRPTGPGYGISKSFYLSILCSRATLPTIRQIVDPKGANGALEGYLAPLMAGATRDERDQPLRRGVYALATKDRKTVLKMMVMAREEAGFDPGVYARSAAALAAPEELLARLRGAWTLTQLTFESFDPEVAPSLDFLLSFCARLGDYGEGVIADPIAERYMLPEQLIQPRPDDMRINALEHVGFRSVVAGPSYSGSTAGMRKFDLPEFELTGLMDPDLHLARRFLLSLAQTVLNAGPVEAGDRFGPFQLAVGGFDRARWEGIPVFEILPPTGQTAGEALRVWEASL